MVIISCNNKKSDRTLKTHLEKLYAVREFTRVKEEISGIEKTTAPEIKYLADSLLDYIGRYQKEYPWSENDNPQKLLQSRFGELPDTLLPYVSERFPHIVFSSRIKGNLQIPLQMAECSLSKWLNGSITGSMRIFHGQELLNTA